MLFIFFPLYRHSIYGCADTEINHTQIGNS
nr:MAG TPA: hypothetical protein [Caudoviricetes sp.]